MSTSYLYSDFSSEDRVSFLELEITRLQELCRQHFVMMDGMKKECKRLQEVHIELKETTSDLAYSLASVQCPWWQSESLQSAVKILASFAQKIQYILELPTFIDPMEQLEGNGRLSNHRVANYIAKNNNNRIISNKSITYARACQKCKKKFKKISSYVLHSRLPGHGKTKKLKCRFCYEAFQSFIGYKIHLKNFHSFPETFLENDDHRKEQQQSIAEFFKRNHVRVWRFIKCQVCDTMCSSTASLKNHQKYCRVLLQQEEESSPITNIPTSIFKSSHSSIEKTEKNIEESSSKNCEQRKGQLIDLTSRPHLIVTLHEDTSETEIEKDDTLLGHHTTNNKSLKVNSETKYGAPSEQIQSSSSITAPVVTSSNENNENVTTEPTVDIEPMTVAEAPVRLSSMHAFSINTTTVPSTSTAIPSTSNSVDTVAAKNTKACVTLDGVVGNSGKLENSTTSTHDTATTSKITTTMCFLPSSSSSWESDKDAPSPSSQGTQCPVSEGGLIVNTKFSCSHRNCTRSFMTRGKLFHHEKTHTEIGESRSFSCQLCSKVFKDKYRLKTHFFTHCSDNSQKLMYRCIECGVFHDTLIDLAKHTELDHSESKLKGTRYQCQSCTFCTNFRCKLDLHLKSSHHQCRVSSSRSKGGGGDSSSRVGGYTVFRDESVL